MDELYKYICVFFLINIINILSSLFYERYHSSSHSKPYLWASEINMDCVKILLNALR